MNLMPYEYTVRRPGAPTCLLILALLLVVQLLLALCSKSSYVILNMHRFESVDY